MGWPPPPTKWPCYTVHLRSGPTGETVTAHGTLEAAVERGIAAQVKARITGDVDLTVWIGRWHAGWPINYGEQIEARYVTPDAAREYLREGLV